MRLIEMIWGHNRDGGSCHDGISLIPTSRDTFQLRALDSWPPFAAL